MKTSLLLIILITLNTTTIVLKPIALLISEINMYWLIGIEVILIIGYYANKTIRDLQSHCEIDCNALELYIIKGNKK
ncbi:hypothetical protein [Algibacter sp. R77976]|uniref:hypothetical protein n=1 Tax=Algibacter sp. R77976 TaxID=3093873 RepID=UPI0037CCBB2B